MQLAACGQSKSVFEDHARNDVLRLAERAVAIERIQALSFDAGGAQVDQVFVGFGLFHSILLWSGENAATIRDVGMISTKRRILEGIL